MGAREPSDGDVARWREVLGGGRAADGVLDDEEVRHAIATGDPLRVHRALCRLRRRTQYHADREILDAILSDRRVFARPAARAPGVGSFKGIGAGLYFREDEDADDDSYVTTRCIFVFWIPVIPSDAWLLRRADDGGAEVLGRVPLSRPMLLWRAVALPSAVILVAALTILLVD